MEGDVFATATFFHAQTISIHSLRMEGDHRQRRRRQREGISIHSLRMEGDDYARLFFQKILYFNPLPPHGGRHISDGRCVEEWEISIHSLRMEGDICHQYFLSFVCISIHSLRMEGDHILGVESQFPIYFNPLPPHGGRPSPHKPITPFCNISIHSLRMEGDYAEHLQYQFPNVFQSTPSAWRETSPFQAFGQC